MNILNKSYALIQFLISLLIPIITFTAIYTVLKLEQPSTATIELIKTEIKSLENKSSVEAENLLKERKVELEKKEKELIIQKQALQKPFYITLYVISLLVFLLCLIFAHYIQHWVREAFIDGGFFTFMIGIWLTIGAFQDPLAEIILKIIIAAMIAFFESNRLYQRKKKIEANKLV